jgi:UDP-2,3-diacylglucosamine hydrolase
MSLFLISDIHADASRPAIAEQLLSFIKGPAADAEALYILGDLFETWIGDDDPDPEKHRIVHALHDLTQGGVPCYFLPGNRDFLTGQVFADRTGCVMLDDPTVVQLHDVPVLLLHGDTLCADDHEYQAFRRMVRDPIWQQHFLEKTPEHRIAMAQQARDASNTHTDAKPPDIMDVSQTAVNAVMREHGINTMIHGHTHRPGIHHFELDGQPATRIVLGDWYEQGSVLRWAAGNYHLDSLPR